MTMWEARAAQEYAEKLTELHTQLDGIAVRIARIREGLHRTERRKELAATALRGAYEPNDEPLSSQEMCSRF
jgi:hypothetical protein